MSSDPPKPRRGRPPVPPEERRVIANVRLPAQLMERVNRAAEAGSRTVTDVVERALEAYLADDTDGDPSQLIVSEIVRCAREYEMSTGVRPKRIYLGRDEIVALAKAFGFQDQPAPAIVYGMNVFEVLGAGPHMRCSI